MTESYSYDAESFWDHLLASRFDLTGVGHGAFGPRYNRYLYRAKLRAFDRALAEGGVEVRDRDILDVGCGTGVFTQKALALGARSYLGLDISATSVASLRERHPESRFEQRDIGEPGLDLGTFDVVWCFDVVYHVVDEARFGNAVQNLWAAVRPGGTLLLVDAFGTRPYMPHEHVGYVPHVRYRPLASYHRDLLAHDNAHVAGVVPMYALLNRPVVGAHWPWTRRRLSWQLRRRMLESRVALETLYRVDGLLTRVRRGDADLKILVVRKEVRT
jgi:SAM-dependent methyltransferase